MVENERSLKKEEANNYKKSLTQEVRQKRDISERRSKG